MFSICICMLGSDSPTTGRTVQDCPGQTNKLEEFVYISHLTWKSRTLTVFMLFMLQSDTILRRLFCLIIYLSRLLVVEQYLSEKYIEIFPNFPPV